MTRRPARITDRAAAGAIDFDAALEAFFETGDLLQAASMVLGSTIPLDEDRAEAIAALTGCPYELVDYDDAARAVRRWAAMMEEPGARH